MKNFLYFIMVIFLFLSSAGCASVGKDFESEKVKNIKNNSITNYSELSALLNANGMSRIEKWIPSATINDRTDTAQLDRIYRVIISSKSFSELSMLKSQLELLDIVYYAELETNNKVWPRSG